MKRSRKLCWRGFLLIVLPGLLISGCSPVPADAKKHAASDHAIIQTVTFQINPHMPNYLSTASIQNDQITRITITDSTTGAAIQSITPPANEVFTKSSVYFQDVTFNGNLSLLMPLQQSASRVTFNAYVWDAATKQFVEDPSFQNIENPSIDAAGKRILSHASASQITTYGMYSFINGEFVPTNTLSWQPAELDADPVPNASELAHLIEQEGEAIVKDLYVPSDGPYEIDQQDPRVAAYFAPGSFWDLGSTKWQSAFADNGRP